MKTHKIDENTIWEETGNVTVHNYPPSPMTFSYVTKTYREMKIDKLGYKIVEGNPYYFKDMKQDEIAFAKIMSECENNLLNKLNAKDII